MIFQNYSTSSASGGVKLGEMTGDLQILPDFYATPCRFLWHASSRTAVLSDLHLGVEETLARQGIYLPDVSTPLVKQRWAALVDRQPAQIVIAGDLFDAPGPSDRAIALCRELLSQAPCPVTIIPGNHDPDSDTLETILVNLSVTVAPFLLIRKTLISHGHDLTIDEAASHAPQVWIVGHQHPALTLATRVQHAKMPCFALCRRTAPPPHILLLPAFSPAPLGSNLLTQSHWLLPFDRPPNDHIDIVGLIEPADRPPQVLPFGTLAMHAP